MKKLTRIFLCALMLIYGLTFSILLAFRFVKFPEGMSEEATQIINKIHNYNGFTIIISIMGFLIPFLIYKYVINYKSKIQKVAIILTSFLLIAYFLLGFVLKYENRIFVIIFTLLHVLILIKYKKDLTTYINKKNITWAVEGGGG